MNSVILIDDEPPARRKLARLLEPHKDFQITGEAASVVAAVALLTERPPDLLFLDVQMPDGTGFDVLQQLPESIRPLTIFVTAHNHHAVDAFTIRALDYLLKPVSPSRFSASIDRARLHLAKPENTFRRRVLIRDEQLTYFVETAAIDWLESARNYVVLHTAGRTHIVRATLEGLLEQLDPAQFVRISRSAAINLAQLKVISAESVILKSSEELKASPRYLSGLKSLHWV